MMRKKPIHKHWVIRKVRQFHYPTPSGQVGVLFEDPEDSTQQHAIICVYSSWVKATMKAHLGKPIGDLLLVLNAYFSRRVA